MDFDTDGCYNTPAIDGNGSVATGLDCGGAKNGHCRDLSDLQNNNVYSRARCNNGWCGFLYGYYFEKDQSVDGSCGVGHKNDWERECPPEVVSSPLQQGRDLIFLRW